MGCVGAGGASTIRGERQGCVPDKQHKPLVGQETGEFEQRYEEWSARVYRYLAHLLGFGSTTDDLFQETWMKAIEHQGQLRDRRRFGPWILRIARNLAFNHARLRRRRAQVWILSSLSAETGASPDTGPYAGQADGRPGPREEAIQAERRRILSEVLSGVDEDVKEMLQLRYFENLTLAEVAAVVDQPLGTVCTKVYRALRQIRQRMELQGYPGLRAM